MESVTPNVLADLGDASSRFRSSHVNVIRARDTIDFNNLFLLGETKETYSTFKAKNLSNLISYVIVWSTQLINNIQT